MKKSQNNKPLKSPGRSPESIQWLAESVRFTAFYTDDTDAKAPFYEELYDAKPDRVVERPNEGVRQELGIFGDHRLALSNRPGRTDLLLATPKSPDSIPYAQIGPYEEALRAFKPIVMKWFRKSPPLKRLAVGLILILECPTKVEGYALLKKLLPVPEFDPKIETDIFWQVNRPRPSKVVHGLRINRLSKWQVVEVRILSVGIDGKSNPATPGTPLLQLELDINTDGERTAPFKKSALNPLLEELTKLSIEIASVGDVR